MTGLMVSSLTGCALYKVVTFDDDKRSYQLKDQIVYVTILGSRGQVQPSGQVQPEARAALGLPSVVAAACKEVKLPPGTLKPKVAPLLVPFILAAATITVNELGSALQGYIQTEKEKFVKSYGGATNTGHLSFYDVDAARCIRVQRTIRTPEPASTEEVALDFVVSLEHVEGADNALLLRPRYLSLQKSAAMTGTDPGTIDLDIGIGISVVRNVNQQNELYALAQKNFKFAAVPIGTRVAANEPAIEMKEPATKIKFVDSAVFPMPRFPTAATIAVSVLETGSGADDFGNASKSIEANKGAIANALDGFLKEKLKD
jgi:hypothetical protein